MGLPGFYAETALGDGRRDYHGTVRSRYMASSLVVLSMDDPVPVRPQPSPGGPGGGTSLTCALAYGLCLAGCAGVSGPLVAACIAGCQFQLDACG